MFLIRWGFWIAIAVMLLPTDKGQQDRLIARASDAAHWTFTFCDRNTATCTQAGQLWQTFKTKAQFGAELAADMMRQQTAPKPGTTQGGHVAPQPAPTAPAAFRKLEDRLPLYPGERIRFDG